MKLGIIGSGNVGGTLGRLFAQHGHEVMFGLRDPSKAIEPGARAGTVAEAARFGEVIVLATPWVAARDAVGALGDIAGKVLIDCVNPIAPQLAGLAIGTTTSAAEQIQGWAQGARVVKCFNTLGAQNFGAPQFGDQVASMFLCGGDADAKAIVSRLGAELGFDMVDAGALTQARYLEPLAMLWITMAYAYGKGPGMAFKLLRR